MVSHRLWATAALAVAALARVGGPATAQTPSDGAFRPPAVPLVTHNPFLSIWSESDQLTDSNTRHWTQREYTLSSLIRIDGKTYRLMGKTPEEAPALPQTSLQVTPLHSIYQFDDGHVHVTLTFLTTALPNDLEAFARPLSYLTWQVRSADGANHTVALFDSTSARITVNVPTEKVVWRRGTAGPLTTLRAGSERQPVLQSMGDDHRIEWGYAYVAAPTAESSSTIGAKADVEAAFADTGKLPAADDARMPRAANDAEPVMAFAFDLGTVGSTPVQRQVIVAYDEIYAIKYFSKKLRPYWSRNGQTPEGLLQAAARDFASLDKRCTDFDNEITADATRLGGARYAQIAALAWRQCAAACGLAADAKGQPLFFTKENSSNGDIATVDVMFPMCPQWILTSPTLAKASLVPILTYADSWHWKFPNAPHDLGTYPVVRGTDDGGEGMPVEESGNMLIMIDAIAQIDGNANFIKPWWGKISQWAQYLEKYGLDPEEQLCTDDFMGHLAHNANLSIKAILGLACYGDLCRIRGDKANAKRYTDLARTDAAHWMQAANDGDHSRLAFDKPNTWSQKYNLVWDQILGLNIFPASVRQSEVAYYKKMLQPYGVPLDSRTHLTKTDWSLWSATLATNEADFQTIVSPIYDYLNTTTARLPLADSYETDNIASAGMRARPVVGGLFIKLLADRATWIKWASRDKTKVGGWAPLPPAPTVKVIVPPSKDEPAVWRYTTHQPAEGWTSASFDDSGWQSGKGAFGTSGTPSIEPATRWDTDDIWIRRTLTLPAGDYSHAKFWGFHDEDVEIYVNGIPAGSEGGFVSSYGPIEITDAARALLKPGATITIAAHCHQTGGGQGLDLGIASVIEPK